MKRPDKSEHHEYYTKYIDQVPDGDILQILRSGIDETAALLKGQPPSIAGYRYAPDKWSVGDVIAHLSDCERTFGFRAFWFARKGAGELPSLDQDPFAAEAHASARSLETLMAEWRAVRASTLALFEAIDDETSMRTGVASGNRITVRALAWIIAGHEIHHRKGLKDQYLARMPAAS